MKQKITINKAKETVKEFYGIENEKCPICNKKLKNVTGVLKIGNAGFHLECTCNNILK